MMLAAIEWYQRAAEGRLSPCRFFPSCSEYGHEAIRVHGAGRGLWLTTRRLMRCRPFGPSGVDPVPEPAGDRGLEPDRWTHGRAPVAADSLGDQRCGRPDVADAGPAHFGPAHPRPHDAESEAVR